MGQQNIVGRYREPSLFCCLSFSLALACAECASLLRASLVCVGAGCVTSCTPVSLPLWHSSPEPSCLVVAVLALLGSPADRFVFVFARLCAAFHFHLLGDKENAKRSFFQARPRTHQPLPFSSLCRRRRFVSSCVTCSLCSFLASDFLAGFVAGFVAGWCSPLNIPCPLSVARA